MTTSDSTTLAAGFGVRLYVRRGALYMSEHGNHSIVTDRGHALALLSLLGADDKARRKALAVVS